VPARRHGDGLEEPVLLQRRRPPVDGDVPAGLEELQAPQLHGRRAVEVRHVAVRAVAAHAVSVEK
jgi:hypothetical protein